MQIKNICFKYYFIKIFLITLLITSLLSAVVFFYRYNARKENLVNLYSEQLELRHTEVEFHLSNVVSDLNILSEFEVFRNFINFEDVLSFKSVEQIFKLICTERQSYDQIRFIDKTGMEVIRINYNNGNPVIVPEKNLQFKGDRYYFEDTFELEKGEVFFSPLDLNIENGLIEKPEKPMIRIGIPVFDDRMMKQGIILVNYFGHNIIDVVSRPYKNSISSFFLLNNNSFWLYSQNPDRNWAFMYEEKNNENFKKEYPEIWEQILSKPSGILEASRSIYIFTTISPLHQHIKTSTGSSSAYSKSEMLDPDDYFWKLAVSLSPKVLQDLRRMVAADLLPLLIGIFIAGILISLILSRLWFVQKLSEIRTKKSLAEKELLLREIHHRVKNSLSLVSSFIGLYRNENDEESNDAFYNALQQKIETISLVHTYLYQSNDIENINLKNYLKELLENTLNNLAVSDGNISLQLDIQDLNLPAKSAIAIGLIISELSINSLKHAFPDNKTGVISVKISHTELNYTIVYQDDGIGLPKDFIIGNSKSLGMILIESLTEQLSGNLKISTGRNGYFTFEFPVHIQ
ncbi:MAG: sensor histidine kinase [Spirochaetia bacterium]|jgi:two-component sensor histidine kinase|nr:sensor histidine kinase [Spirochaetia bacterium]